MQARPRTIRRLLHSTVSVLLASFTLMHPCGAQTHPAAVQAKSTEDFLNTLGVNTHLNGLTASDPWDTDAARVGAQLKYLGVRLDRDWAWSLADGKTWKAVQTAWGPYGRFWSSIDEASPATQRRNLGFEEAIWSAYPGLISVMGGPNEEDNSYPQQQGATLPDAATVQQSLYTWAHSEGRNVPVSQMEFGAGWTAANNWQGDYNPKNTGLGQNYTPGPADIGGAHTYLSNPQERPVEVLDRVRALATLTTPGKPVAHTEFGAYQAVHISAQTYGQFVVMGAFDSMAAGDIGYLVYGLQDSGPEQSYGFYNYPGHVPHAAATNYHVMTTILASLHGSYGPGAGRTFVPGSLPVAYTNTLAASHLLMQKPTGEYVIADCSEQLMNGSEHPVSDTIHFGRTFGTVQIYNIEHGTVPVATLHDVSQHTLSMDPSDTYLLILSDKSTFSKGKI